MQDYSHKASDDELATVLCLDIDGCMMAGNAVLALIELLKWGNSPRDTLGS